MNFCKNNFALEEFQRFMSDVLSPPVRVEYKRLHPEAKLPTRANPDDAASDLYAVEDMTIHPGETKNVDTGLAFAVPAGWYTTINGRSSLNKRGLLAFRGVIDAGYTDRLMVSLTNTGAMPYSVKVGDRVGQLTVHRRIDYTATEVEEFSPTHSMRGSRGFGSSGR